MPLFLVSYRPENPSAYLQDVWLPSCNLKFRWQGLLYIRIIKFIVGTTLGWGNFGLGQLWARPTLIWANYVWGNFGPANFGPGNNGWGNFELIPSGLPYISIYLEDFNKQKPLITKVVWLQFFYLGFLVCGFLFVARVAS